MKPDNKGRALIARPFVESFDEPIVKLELDWVSIAFAVVSLAISALALIGVYQVAQWVAAPLKGML